MALLIQIIMEAALSCLKFTVDSIPLMKESAKHSTKSTPDKIWVDFM